MTYNYLLGLWGKKGGGLAIDVSSELVLLSKKRRISMNVNSGLIFLTKKEKELTSHSVKNSTMASNSF